MLRIATTVAEKVRSSGKVLPDLGIGNVATVKVQERFFRMSDTIDIEWSESPDDERGTWAGTFHGIEVRLRICNDTDTWSGMVDGATVDNFYATREAALLRVVKHLAERICEWTLQKVKFHDDPHLFPGCTLSDSIYVPDEYPAGYYKFCPFCGKFLEQKA